MTTSTSNTRQLTICSKGFPRQYHEYVFFPNIPLAGKWLQDAGFKIGQVINVIYSEGKLEISIAKDKG